MFRFVAPAGSPLSLKQVLRCSADASDRGGREQLRTFARRFGVRYAFGTSSGRGALLLALQALHRLRPNRDLVAIPAYTCFSVPAALARAGLKIYPVEIDPRTLDFDPSALSAAPRDRLLCIIPCNLFGFPNDISAVRDIADLAGSYVLDDAAQALGSNDGNHAVGTRGDVGIYSLGRGKSVGSVGGGVLVTDSDEIAEAAESEWAAFDDPAEMSGAVLLARMLSYSVLLHPRLFWIPNSLPFLKLGVTEFDPSFHTRKMHGLTAALLEAQLSEVDRINQIRRENAKVVVDGLRASANFAVPEFGPEKQATLVRLPIVADDQATRDRAVVLLRDAGIGATAFYPSAVCDIPGIEERLFPCGLHCSRAEQLSRTLLTVPVHPFVRPKDIERMVGILTNLSRKSGLGTATLVNPGESNRHPAVSPAPEQTTATQESRPRVSVIIPTYNSAEMIGEAIESVLAQTYSDFEVIVIDDGSTDRTEDIVRRFCNRVRYFKQENQGVSAARNTGIEKSRGRYIAFLDSDDLWRPDKLAQQVPLLDADAHLGLVYCDWTVMSGETVIQESYHQALRPARGYVFNELVQRGFILTSGVVVRRECLDDVGRFDKSLSVAEDYDLWLRISYRWKIELVDNCLFSKRQWNGSLSCRLTETAASRIVLFQRMLAELADMTPQRQRLVRQQLSLSYWDVGYDCFDRLSFAEARKNFRSSLAYDWANFRAVAYLTASCLPISVVRAMRTVKRAQA